jgi:hypothetical protein
MTTAVIALHGRPVTVPSGKEQFFMVQGNTRSGQRHRLVVLGSRTAAPNAIRHMVSQCLAANDSVLAGC